MLAAGRLPSGEVKATGLEPEGPGARGCQVLAASQGRDLEDGGTRKTDPLPTPP